MSRADLEQAMERLQHARTEVLWALSVLHDPNVALRDYELSPAELDQLFQAFHASLGQIHATLARELSREIEIEVGGSVTRMVGPIPPWLLRIVKGVGPIGPFIERPEEPERRRGRREGSDDSGLETVGPAGPF